MSSETQPINPARFAEALRELSAESLALKVLELRNAIAHLDYSNAELAPFAEGRAAAPREPQGEPDRDCADAIAENEAVIARMQDRIERVRVEVERRGLSWGEFQGKSDGEEGGEGEGEGVGEATADGADAVTNGVNGHAAEGETQHPAWRDGTFQTGTIGELGEEERELLRRLEQRIPLDDDEEEEDPEGGMHL
ncbi:hypothetical protein F5B19DRAFT_499985 [Rostrohypoxylon terebratum]|nr:hypothetical protein F5B19DRAFT_499985 [Rostrohypoxylon terebratum]